MLHMRLSPATDSRAGADRAARQPAEEVLLVVESRRASCRSRRTGLQDLLWTGWLSRLGQCTMVTKNRAEVCAKAPWFSSQNKQDDVCRVKTEQRCSHRPEKWPVTHSKALRPQYIPSYVAYTATLPPEHERIPYQFSMSSSHRPRDHALQGCQPDTRDNRMVLLKAVRERGTFLMLLASTNHSQHQPGRSSTPSRLHL